MQMVKYELKHHNTTVHVHEYAQTQYYVDYVLTCKVCEWMLSQYMRIPISAFVLLLKMTITNFCSLAAEVSHHFRDFKKMATMRCASCSVLSVLTLNFFKVFSALFEYLQGTWWEWEVVWEWEHWIKWLTGITLVSDSIKWTKFSTTRARLALKISNFLCHSTSLGFHFNSIQFHLSITASITIQTVSRRFTESEASCS